jgi:hypothetical protein
VAEADDEDAGDGADTVLGGGNHGASGDVAGARVEGRLPPSQLFVCTLDGTMQLFPTDQVLYRRQCCTRRALFIPYSGPAIVHTYLGLY